MSKPFISVICLAYGQHQRVEEAIACFLAQVYDGPKELIVYNSAPQQTLTGDFPNVRIINAESRPPSLGICRNMAIAEAKGDFIAILDSDDEILPGHLQRYADALTAHPEAAWVRLTPTFYAEKWVIRNLFGSWCNSIGFTVKAWRTLGGYSDSLSVGEDRQFIGRLSETFPGTTVELKPEQVTAIYNWDTGTYHISGLGMDKPNVIPAYERTRLDFEMRLRRGLEPHGRIELHPQLEHDPQQMVDAFFHRPQSLISKTSVALVYLGRFGDIINVLPIAQHIANTYGKPYFVVSREFAPLLDGVSYVEPYPVAYNFDEINEAVTLAKRKFAHVIQCQIWGKNFQQVHLTESYNKEAWRVAGFLPQFDNPAWRPVFDRRDAQEEHNLCEKLNPERKPTIVVNVTSGFSSKLTTGQALLEHLREAWGKEYLVINVAGLRCKHIYDLLGLIDAAWAVVSIDTALLHLCAAAQTPTLALVNPTPWLGTSPRFKHCEILKYDALEGGWAKFDAALARVLAMPKPASIAPLPIHPAPTRRIFHAVERHLDGAAEIKRKEQAIRSWELLYGNGVIPCHYREYKRNARVQIRDHRDLPYLKDVLQFAMDQASAQDIIMWTNDDNILHPDTANAVTLHCALWGAVSSQRCEFKGIVPSMDSAPEHIALRGNKHMGRDLFAFTKEWLTERWEEIPDFILGASDFDLCLACIIRLQWGIRSNRVNMEQTLWPAELHRGYVSHRFHPPKWNHPNNRETAPSQIWNRRLFREWARKHLPELKFYPNNTI